MTPPAAKEPEEIAREIELAEEIIRDWACYVVLNDKVEEFPIAEYNELRKLIASALRAAEEKGWLACCDELIAMQEAADNHTEAEACISAATYLRAMRAEGK